MRADTIYYVESDRGVGLYAAQNIAQARKNAKRSIGTHSFRGIRKATQEEVDWISAMGGRVLEGKAL